MEKMTCEKAKELFDRSIDGELGEKERELFDEHLKHCEGCRKELRELEAIHSYMSTMAVEVPSELHKKVMASIKKEPKPFLLRATWLRPLIAVSAAALLCVAVLHLPVTDMFKANSKADNMEVAPDMDEIYSSNLKDMMDDISGGITAEQERPQTPSEEKAEDGIHEWQNGQPDPEIKQVYAIADTDLLLMIFNEKQAMLCRLGNEEATEMLHRFTYKETDGVILLEDNGKTQSLRIEGDRLSPINDGTLLDPFLS